MTGFFGKYGSKPPIAHVLYKFLAIYLIVLLEGKALTNWLCMARSGFKMFPPQVILLCI